MIQISRFLARQLRAFFRSMACKSVSTSPAISFRAGDDGLRVRFHHGEMAAEFHQPGTFQSEILGFSLDALKDFEGRQDDLVILETTGPGNVQGRWDDHGVPQIKDFPAEDVGKVPKFPDVPETMAVNEPGFLKALADACQSAAGEQIRYAIDHIQLRGGAGEVVATDGKQLLVQNGWQFPWPEDVLIPATSVFGKKELPQDVPVSIGKTKTHVTLHVGAWIFHLPIDTVSRFPVTGSIIPKEAAAKTRCRIDGEDAVFLEKRLPRMPGASDEYAPVTLDLNGEVLIRAKASDQTRSTELVLARSQVTGNPVRVNVQRMLVARGIQLGFRDLNVVNADVPFLFQTRFLQYLCNFEGDHSFFPRFLGVRWRARKT